MSSTLITNIGSLRGTRSSVSLLRGKDLAELPFVANAYLFVKDGLIEDYGTMNKLPASLRSEKAIDATGQLILPAWCDSHTHLVFPATREDEFIDKIRGVSYAEIAARGGGILNSAAKLNAMDEKELFLGAKKRLHEIIRQGTGAVEIKSGYGLSLEGELKMLRVIRRLKDDSPIPVKATFLGAHAFPAAFRNHHEAYVKLIIDEMLPIIGKEKLADYVDVFCEQGFFTNEDTEKICHAAKQYGLRPKLHANQLSSTGAVQTGVNMNALSVDHLENMDEAAIHSLANSRTIGTLLPGAAFFLRMNYPPARQLIDAGAALALASDYNPGSCPTGNMNLIIAMACIQMRMLPEEAINAATINGSFAMELENELGTITIGKRANLIFTQPIDSINLLPYFFGTNLNQNVMINGEFFE